MKLWLSVKIKARKWRCYKCKTVTDEGDKLQGLCDYGPGTIKVRIQEDVEEIPASKIERAILVHELLHALGDAFGYELRDSGRPGGEATIDRVAISLLKFNEDNPRFWERMRK